MKRLINFLFEIGSLRKIPRAHKTSLMSEDPTDNIASHSYRVTHIGYLLAKLEGVDANKVVLMTLFHDVEETRSGDQNRVNKRYVTVDHEQILKDQLDGLTEDNEIYDIMNEYKVRESLESKVAKDADILDQIFILKEYALTGHKEAQRRLDYGYYNDKTRFNTESGWTLMQELMASNPQDWWSGVWTEQRKH